MFYPRPPTRFSGGPASDRRRFSSGELGPRSFDVTLAVRVDGFLGAPFGASSAPFGGASSGAPSALVNGRRWFRQEALGKIGFGGFKVE